MACTETPGPSEASLPPEADLLFEGAVEVDRSFVEENHDRGIDGLDLSNPARLSRTLRLSEPVAINAITDFYERELVAMGWEVRVDDEYSLRLARTFENRVHDYRIEGGTQPGQIVEEYHTDYYVQFADE